MTNFLGSETKKHWKSKVLALESSVDLTSQHLGWVPKAEIKKALGVVSDTLLEDLKVLEGEGDFLLSSEQNIRVLTEQTVEALRRWSVHGRCPSLVALCIYACEHFSVKRPDLIYGLLMAGVLGEVETDLIYHNNMHYRKVLIQVIRMISVHNDIYGETSREFNEEQMALAMIGACIHDLGHDGKGNTIKGVFFKNRMERLSFEFARPFLELAGLTDDEMLQKLLVMLLCTDVTPLNSPVNPVNQMKAAYRFHYLGDDKKTDNLNLSSELKRLEKDRALTAVSLLLHEADVATSAGLGYEMTKYETSLYRREVCDDEATPRHVVEFLNTICQRSMLSEAAQKLYASNLARTMALAERDVENGNAPFPAPEHSHFILGLLPEKTSGQSRVVN